MMSSFVGSAKSLDILKFELDPFDMTAAVEIKKDANGVDCALIKVKSLTTDCIIQGNVVGTPQKKGSEIWCYVTAGTKEIRLLSTIFDTVVVKF